MLACARAASRRERASQAAARSPRFREPWKSRRAQTRPNNSAPTKERRGSRVQTRPRDRTEHKNSVARFCRSAASKPDWLHVPPEWGADTPPTHQKIDAVTRRGPPWRVGGESRGRQGRLFAMHPRFAWAPPPGLCWTKGRRAYSSTGRRSPKPEAQRPETR